MYEPIRTSRDNGLHADEDYEIVVVVDPVSSRVPIVYTGGLADQGLPELAMQPPPWFEPPEGMTWREFGLFLADVLRELAADFLDYEDDESLCRIMDLNDDEVEFWGTDCPPSGPATRHLDEFVDEIREVACSLWSEAPEISAARPE